MVFLVCFIEWHAELRAVFINHIVKKNGQGIQFSTFRAQHTIVKHYYPPLQWLLGNELMLFFCFIVALVIISHGLIPRVEGVDGS